MHAVVRFVAMGLAVAVALAAAPAGAQTQKPYEPTVGQEGKDVIWVPTPDELVTKMLTMAKVGPTDTVVDLGAGDGKIAIAAAKEFGARSRGVEFNPDMAKLAQANAVKAGVADKVQIIQGDIFETDFSDATVVTLYLLPTLNMRLRPTLLAMKPGTRVVSHAFDMGDWNPDDRATTDEATAYLWIVPAKVEGRWSGKTKTPGALDLTLKQTHQEVSGTATVNGRALTITNPSLKGEALALWLEDGKGASWRLEGTLAGDSFKGTIRQGLKGAPTPITLTRSPAPQR